MSIKHIGDEMEERSWQIESHSIIDKCNMNDQKNVIPVNACVGSGKTNVASYSLGSFIKQNIDKKTLQVFVTPRIKLCKQQAESIAKYIKEQFGLEAGGIDYEILRYDCSVATSKLNLREDTFVPHHAIIVICDESLWGVDDNAEDKEHRWHSWIHFFNKRISGGYLLGNCIFDEAHNFTRNHDKIFGEEAI